MEIMQFLDLGAIGAMLVVLVWIVKAFLSHLKSKDEIFSETINNHLHDDAELKGKLVEILNKVEKKL